MGGKIADQLTTHVVQPTDQEGSGVFPAALSDEQKEEEPF